MKTWKITLRLGVNSLFLFYSAKVKYQLVKNEFEYI